MNGFSFNTCPRLICEAGSSLQLAEQCRLLGMKHALIVTDPGVRAAGLLDEVCVGMEKAALAFTVFDRIEPDPSDALVQTVVAVAREAGADGVVGFGGGSSMDSAKLVALLLRSGESLDSVYGVNQAKGPRLPLILVPTTAGTGSEVTAVSIVTTGATTKTGVVSPLLLPDLALLDPLLTSGLPPAITAATGVDAMVHAVEAYTSALRKNPYSDMLARRALELMSANILTATHSGSDLAAREAMLLGACLAGQAFANAPVAAVHALAYPLGGHYHIPHGLSNSLVLPHVLEFNMPSAMQQYAELARLVLPPEQCAGTATDLAQAFVAWFRQLISALQLPETLAAVGVKEADLPMLAADAMLQQRLLINNPREVTETDALAIYRAAYV